MSSQINIRKSSSFIAPPDGSKGYGFNSNGDPVVVNETGQAVPLAVAQENPSNIVANKGVGIEANLPSVGVIAGDVYVTNDTFKIYTAIDSVTWDVKDLVNGQFVTDVSETTELPPLYQYWNNNLMPIANYSETPPAGVPE